MDDSGRGRRSLVKVFILQPGELDEAQLSRWRAMQSADPRLHNPFLSPEFALAVGRVRQTARVAVLDDAGEPIGFFPFERRTFGIGKPIGSGVSDCQALISSPGSEWDADDLLRACGLAAWEFDHLIAGQAWIAPEHQLHASPVIDLRRGFDAYVEERRQVSKSLVASTLRKARKLASEVGPLRLEEDVTDPGALRTLMRWKSSQYHRTGAADRFGIDWIVRLLEDLLAARGPGFTPSLTMLYAGDRAVAGHFGLRSPSVLSWWFPAYDEAFQRYSPGRYLLLRIAESAAAQGVGSIDLGRGVEEYKHRFASWEAYVAEGAVRRPGVVASARELTRLPRRLGVRYLAGTPLEPVAQSALGAVKRWRKAVG
jgi:CelD/BcsL family acetyltransferase involved in cellulose biosynthesis